MFKYYKDVWLYGYDAGYPMEWYKEIENILNSTDQRYNKGMKDHSHYSCKERWDFVGKGGQLYCCVCKPHLGCPFGNKNAKEWDKNIDDILDDILDNTRSGGLQARFV